MTSPADRCENVLVELEAFHLGQLTEAESARVRDHVGACDACRAELEEVRDLFALADRVEVIEPSAAFRRRMTTLVENEVGPRSQADRGPATAVLTLLAFAGARFQSSRRFRYVTLAAAAHVLILAVLTIFVIPAAKREHDFRVVWSPPSDFAERALENQQIDDDPGAPPVVMPEEIVDGGLEEIMPPVEGAPELEPSRPDPKSWNRRIPTRRRFPTMQVAMLMRNRLDSSLKERRVREARGDLRTLKAIRAASGWLVDNQNQEDGSWSAGEGYEGYREGVTGLVLLALLADGHSVHRGDHRDAVARGVGFLRRQQHDGLIADPEFDRPMYGHAIATLALLELWGVDYELMGRGRLSLRRDVKAAVEAIVRAQKADGGWRYRPRRGEADRSAGDVSVTIWQVMALGLAKDSGFDVPPAVLSDARAFLDARSRAEDGAVGYQSRTEIASPLDATLTAGALVVAKDLACDRQITARRRETVRRAIPGADDVRNPLLWFYATQGLNRLGDEGFAAWTGFTTRVLLESQEKDGSWPVEVLRGQQGGRGFTTALGVLILGVDFRDGR